MVYCVNVGVSGVVKVHKKRHRSRVEKAETSTALSELDRLDGELSGSSPRELRVKKRRLELLKL